VSTDTRLRSRVRNAPASCATLRPSGSKSSSAPVAEVASLVWELVLEKLKAREVLEIWVVDPALADTLARQAVDKLVS
jgi:hypothetical protein